jgi:hypothetical protein
MSEMKNGDSVHLDLMDGSKEGTVTHSGNGVNSTQHFGHSRGFLGYVFSNSYNNHDL